MRQDLNNCTYFNGEHFIPNQSIKFNDKVIGEIGATPDSSPGQDSIIPGLIDLQIYGAGNRLFSADPSVESLEIIEKDLLSKGTTSFLICLATNTPEVFRSAINSVKQHRADAKNCMGLHLEGPFLNPKKRGAHIENLIRRAALDEIKELLDFGDGVIKMMTIAPETQDEKVINYLLSNGVVVSLGHSDASFDQATEAFERGIQTTTHLFNAMSGIHHRAPGIPTAVLNHKKAMASIIVDGHHLDFNVVKFSYQLMKERLFLITDAVVPCSEGPYQHQLANGKYVMPDGTLSGSALTMMDAITNCVSHCDIPLEDALNMATKYPSRLMGMEHLVGQIKTGNQANLLVLNKELDIKEVIFGGKTWRG